MLTDEDDGRCCAFCRWGNDTSGRLANGRVVYRTGAFLRQCDTTQIIQGVTTASSVNRGDGERMSFIPLIPHPTTPHPSLWCVGRRSGGAGHGLCWITGSRAIRAACYFLP